MNQLFNNGFNMGNVAGGCVNNNFGNGIGFFGNNCNDLCNFNNYGVTQQNFNRYNSDNINNNNNFNNNFTNNGTTNNNCNVNYNNINGIYNNGLFNMNPLNNMNPMGGMNNINFNQNNVVNNQYNNNNTNNIFNNQYNNNNTNNNNNFNNGWNNFSVNQNNDFNGNISDRININNYNLNNNFNSPNNTNNFMNFNNINNVNPINFNNCNNVNNGNNQNPSNFNLTRSKTMGDLAVSSLVVQKLREIEEENKRKLRKKIFEQKLRKQNHQFKYNDNFYEKNDDKNVYFYDENEIFLGSERVKIKFYVDSVDKYYYDYFDDYTKAEEIVEYFIERFDIHIPINKLSN